MYTFKPPTNPQLCMKSLTILLIAFIFSLNSYADTISDKEKNALIKFYHATNGANWKIKWDLSLSVSTWYGVQTENGKVIGLYLEDNNLEGELPPVFFDLTNLVAIDFHKNSLHGKLSPEIGRLKQLEVLSLFDNKIEGDLPGSIYQLSTLKILLLNNNKLSGTLSSEIINFHALQNLSLFDNSFEGEIPKELEKLHNLAEMNLSYNKFTGTVSKSLALLDPLNMTMLDEDGTPFLLEINTEKETTIVTQN